ncbi:aromatic acid exporter family protein [Xylanibacillus composti]|uniref:UPF0421 protein YgaE n=1 Tax=Xylanibacillus composti TaxID=1572762 RepID=A0A8J4H518_9BACL|nr:aromatic acid exporter family protein [Xylanibacillus composti]MDT9724011.1 aromatic acid exporter family protein [Xylanibacillus composti]GIQ71083.1 UPF0421 protein YgaE [Xylanibacillus composti]
MTMGPRVIKTGLSIVLALYVSALLGLTPAIFAAVAAIFTIQPSIYRTWRQVFEQVQANVLGAAVAMLAVISLGNSPIVIGIVSVLVIMISLKLKAEKTIALTMVTVLVIMDAPGDDWTFALNRFAIIMVGMASAFIVNIALWPPRHEKQFVEGVHAAFDQMSLLLRTSISNEMTEKAFRRQREELRTKLEKLDELFSLFNEERRKLKRVKPVHVINARRFVVFKKMLLTLHKGAEVLDIVTKHYFQSTHHAEAGDIFDKHIEHLITYHEYVLLKYEGTIKGKETRSREMIRDNGLFMHQVMGFYQADEDNVRLLLVGSAIFDYGFHLHRLERLIEHAKSPEHGSAG